MVQCLRHCAPDAGCWGSIPGQGTRSYMPQLSLHVATKDLRPGAAKKKRVSCVHSLLPHHCSCFSPLQPGVCPHHATEPVPSVLLNPVVGSLTSSYLTFQQNRTQSFTTFWKHVLPLTSEVLDSPAFLPTALASSP